MEKKTPSVIMLILLLTAILAFNFQQFRTIPKVMGEVTSVPDFVNDNVVILEAGAAPQWLDPHVSYYQYDYGILQHSVEMLLWYNGSSSTQVIPWLTESWTPSYTTTANTYTVKLRQGIKFQDGTPLNSSAVWFSLNRLLIIDGTSDTGVHGSQAAWILQQLLDTSLSSYFSGDQLYNSNWVKKVLDQKFVERVDDYTFKINVMTTTTQFPYLFSQPWAAIVSPSEVIKKEYAFHSWGSSNEAFSNMTKYFIRAAGEGHTYYNVPQNGWKSGTGPYYLDSYDPVNYRIVLKINNDYWGGPANLQYPIGKPKIKEIDFNYVESFSTRLLDLKDGKATGIGVGPADLYSVVDHDAWLVNGTFKSLIPDVMIHGPFAQFTTSWFNFITNTTDAMGKLRTFQPMADRRIRLAIASAVNLTEININVNNRLGQVANNLIPPGTAPQGSYNPAISPPWSYDLKKAAELLVDAMIHPLTSFTFYNGTAMPSGLVDNSFGDTNGDGKVEKPYTIEMYVGAADVLSQRILTTIAANLNTMARNKPSGSATGLTFSVVPVPGGQQYTLASKHQIYMYWGGWVADYNHVLDWLVPMYLSTGTYFAWNNINMTTLDGYVNEAYAADATGDLTSLLQYSNLANGFADENVLYFYTFYPLAYFVRSSYLKAWYFNAALSTEYFAPMSYEDLIPPNTVDDYDGLWHSTDFAVTLTAADDMSGVAGTYYKINDGSTKTVSANGQPLITNEGSNNKLEYWSIDHAGNGESHHVLTGIKLDKTSPKANAGVDQIVNEGTMVALDGSASADENGIASYTWTFTDSTSQSLSGKNPTYAFRTMGTYATTLKVTDPAGNYATDTVTITVIDLTKPTANAGSDQAVNEDTPVTLDGSASSDNIGITAYTWTFTDIVPRILTGPKPTYTFNVPGKHTITLNVTDATGNWATDAVDITVLDITKPVTNAGANQTVNVGSPASFDAGGSTDNVGIISYEWSFGDGTTGTGKTVAHSYVNPGTYMVTLTVKDAAGNIGTDSVFVTVLAVEAFPMWVIGAAIGIIGLAVAAVVLLRRPK